MTFLQKVKQAYQLCAELIGYHGTPRSKFDTLRFEQKPTSKQLFGPGLYFTSDKSSARSFATGKYGQIFTVDLSRLKLWDAKTDVKTTKTLAEKLKVNPPQTLDEMKNDGWNYLLDQRRNQSIESIKNKLIQNIKDMGFDGIIVPFRSTFSLPNGSTIKGEDWYIIYKNENNIKYVKKEPKSLSENDPKS